MKEKEVYCYCTHGECTKKTCKLKESESCYSVLTDKGLKRGCVKSKLCWGVDKVNLADEIYNCCDTLMCNSANNANNLRFVNIGDYTKLRKFQEEAALANSKGPVTPDSSLSSTQIALSIAGPVSFVCIIATILFLCHVKRDQKRKKAIKSRVSVENEDFDRYLHEFTTSGSGVGLPLLIQRTIARQIVLGQCVGKGRFGEVHRGTWNDQYVAVKIFATTEEASWFREAQIYQTTMLRHENVLGFIAADNKDTGSCTQLWLVTDYHNNGSLFDYLQDHSLSLPEMMRMIFSIVNGLSHLHIEVTGTRGKPAIAHRDLKTKNILVKSNKECCIADLGLAVLHTSIDSKVDVPTSTRTGTRRYLAPEILNDAIDLLHFDSYRRADIYALGLCIWEICWRAQFTDAADAQNYELPYYHCVGPDPSFEEMRQAVCIEGQRPVIPDSWKNNEATQRICKLLNECWYSSGAARLTSLRIKKDVFTICRELEIEIRT